MLQLIVGALLVVVVTRFIYLASTSGRKAPLTLKRTAPCKTLIVLGSGGHTAEMLRLLRGTDFNHYQPRVYVVATGDKMSMEKVEKLESDCGNRAELDIREIPRARKVRQSYWTSIFSTLLAIGYSFRLVLGTLPQLVLCNGPGTCIPICFTAYLLKFLWLREVRVVYVESICRVEHLSLSGLLLYYVADDLLVQWPQLKDKYPRTQYVGRIV